MARKGPNIQAFNKRFPDEDSCLDHLMRVRFGERLTCFKCQKQATYYRVRGRRSYVCEHCGERLYEEFFPLTDIEKQFPPVFERFFASVSKRTCSRCGTVMERS